MAIGSDSFKLGRALSLSSSEISRSFDKLSSGKRITRASDDAAGLAIANALEAEVRTTLQGARNASDGVSIAQIADSALGQISDITTRQAELATQAANGTLSDDQRQSLNSEFQQLEQEKNRIVSTTTFNGVSVFSGGTLQVGSDSSSNSQIALPSVDTAGITASSGNISSQAAAQSALESATSTLETLNETRGAIGAVVNRVELAENGARSRAVEFESAASRIRDVNVAEETAKLTAASIRQQSTVALGAQTNKLNADVVGKLLG